MRKRTWRMAGAGGRAAGVGVGPAEALDEETAQAMLGAGHFTSGVHGTENRIGRDLLIEAGDQFAEALFADQAVDFSVEKIHEPFIACKR